MSPPHLRNLSSRYAHYVISHYVISHYVTVALRNLSSRYVPLRAHTPSRQHPRQHPPHVHAYTHAHVHANRHSATRPAQEHRAAEAATASSGAHPHGGWGGDLSSNGSPRNDISCNDSPRMDALRHASDGRRSGDKGSWSGSWAGVGLVGRWLRWKGRAADTTRAAEHAVDSAIACSSSHSSTCRQQ